jgi:hypothetical protein
MATTGFSVTEVLLPLEVRVTGDGAREPFAELMP